MYSYFSCTRLYYKVLFSWRSKFCSLLYKANNGSFNTRSSRAYCSNKEQLVVVELGLFAFKAYGKVLRRDTNSAFITKYLE